MEEDLLAGLLEEEEEALAPVEGERKKKEEKEEKREAVELELPVEEPAKTETEKPTPPTGPQSGRITEPLPVEVEEEKPTARPPSPVAEADIIEEEEPPNKLVILIVGEKGTGKTVTALSFPGEVCVLSFDRKAMPVKQFFYKGDRRIHVFEPVKVVDWRPERITETAARAFDYLEKALVKCSQIGVDWVVIDGVDILEQLAEMYMRYRHGLGPIEGIRNLNVWKERRWILRDVHNKALNTARHGVIYTVYPTWQERIVAGEVVDRRQEPRWLDVILFETDVVLWTKYDENMKRFLVEVQTSKLDTLLPTGKVYDVTGNPLGKQLDWSVLGVSGK